MVVESHFPVEQYFEMITPSDILSICDATDIRECKKSEIIHWKLVYTNAHNSLTIRYGLEQIYFLKPHISILIVNLLFLCNVLQLEGVQVLV